MSTMTREEIFATVVEVASEVDREEPGTTALALDDTPLSVYGLSSMSLLQLYTQLEDRLDIRISDGESLRIRTTVHLVDLLERKLQAQPQEAS